MNNMIKKISDGDITVWIEQETSIAIKAITEFNDPVELSGEEARELARTLIEYAEILEE